MHVCVCAHMYLHTCIFTRTVHTPTHPHTHHIHVCVCILELGYVCVCVRACVYTRVFSTRTAHTHTLYVHACVRVCKYMCTHIDTYTPIFYSPTKHVFGRGDSLTVQAGEVTAAAWMDRKMVTIMSTNSQPSAARTVLRKQKDGTRIHVPCPESIISYNMFMGGVDRGDQLRGYYSCRSKVENFTNIFSY